MKELSTLSKVFAVIALASISVWIGAYLTRQFLVYQIFEGPDLILKNYLNENNLSGVLTELLPSILIHFITFIIFIVSFFLFVITSRLKLRLNGWLFIILIATIIIVPFESYLMLIDYKVILLLYSGSFDSNQVIVLLKDRIKDLSSFPIVAILTFISFYYFIVFKPLTKKE
ncbi:MAG: hypothetical protein PHY57_03410 [Ignavibacterium sp.]|jgi:hypothetical protein|nr:MAG: hypothetical protein F9K42_11930 [Ignavibacterium sp.]MDD5607535.1 hypothetical protein [Ignavibacterium sp.]MDX9712635.1 hypothetical protein [Ignavibacteriaceae bacterium]MEB2353844.1 hypothetical protein [Ignavibacteriales bacterium]GIK23030.1 MAG: hypothetical protein BroJett005_24440 [Ignavibacteriota bacterium]